MSCNVRVCFLTVWVTPVDGLFHPQPEKWLSGHPMVQVPIHTTRWQCYHLKPPNGTLLGHSEKFKLLLRMPLS